MLQILGFCQRKPKKESTNQVLDIYIFFDHLNALVYKVGLKPIHQWF
jgi:hypothetical protein